MSRRWGESAPIAVCLAGIFKLSACSRYIRKTFALILDILTSICFRKRKETTLLINLDSEQTLVRGKISE